MADAQELRDRYIPQIPETHPQIYAYEAYVHGENIRPNQIKIGYTARQDFKERIREQEGQMHIKAHVVGRWDAIKQTGDSFTDHDVHALLRDRGFAQVRDDYGKLTEFFECKLEDIDAAVQSIVSGKDVSASRINNYGPRDEQAEAIEKTIESFEHQKASDPSKTPKFILPRILDFNLE